MISNGYCTIQMVKDALRVSDNLDDALIEVSIEAASRTIDTMCGRVFYSQTDTREYPADSNELLYIDDLVSLTSLKTTNTLQWDVTWSANDYQLEPVNGIAGGLVQPYTRIRAIGTLTFPIDTEVTVQVAGVFGWSSVPVDVQMACILQAQRYFKRFDSPLGVAGFGDLGSIRISRFDPDVQAMLQPYMKVSIA